MVPYYRDGRQQPGLDQDEANSLEFQQVSRVSGRDLGIGPSLCALAGIRIEIRVAWTSTDTQI